MKNQIKSLLPIQYQLKLREQYFAFRSLYYSGNRFYCPCCENQFRAFLPYSDRVNAVCPRCGSLERHRIFWLYFKHNLLNSTTSLKILHFAPSYALQRNLKNKANLDYVTVDYFMHGVDTHVDIQNLPFVAEQFDVVICSHVLEHIPNDQQAISELYRLTKPNGYALIQVPIDTSLEKTFEDPTVVDPQERERLFGQDDHVRMYGRDFSQRLIQEGFKVESINYQELATDAEMSYYGLGSDNNGLEETFICRKFV